MSPSLARKLPLALAAIVALALPLVLRSPTYLHILILLYLYAYLTTSWNLVGGFAGVLPLGHATFVGIGAYTSTILSLQYGISPWIGMLVGGVLAGIVGVIIGLPTFKMRGAYFALATIAFAEGIRVMIENIDYARALSDQRPPRSADPAPQDRARQLHVRRPRSPTTTSSSSCWPVSWR